MPKNEEEFPILSEDAIFKYVFDKEEEILTKMISDLTDLDYEKLKDNIIIETNETSSNYIDKKNKERDFIIKINNENIISVEINKYGPAGKVIENLYYLFNLLSKEPIYTYKGINDDALTIIQIDISYYVFENDEIIKPLKQCYLTENNPEKIFTKNLKVSILNVEKCHKEYHNNKNKEISNQVRWGELFHCKNINEIPDITKNILTQEESNIIINKLKNKDENEYLIRKYKEY